MTPAEAIRTLRCDRGWSHKDLAIAVTALRCERVSATQLLAYEAGIEQPPASIANVLLTVLIAEEPSQCERELALVTLTVAAIEAELSEAREERGTLQ